MRLIAISLLITFFLVELVMFMLFFLNINTHIILTTYGCSMYPIITPNTTIFCKPYDDYNVGDIVAYKNSWTNETFLHRIIYKGDGYFVMKGDNLNKTDVGVMKKEDIICKVVKIIKNNNTEYLCN